MIRREFIKNTGLWSAGSAILPNMSFADYKPDMNNIGLQLYTVRKEMEDNPVGTIKKISGIGYAHVECAGYSNDKFYGQTKENFKTILMDHGLKMLSGHVMTGFGKPEGTYSMKYMWEKYCEDAAFMGQKYIVSAYFLEGERKTIDDYKKHADLFNTCAEKAKPFGLIFCHHNHDFEFIPIDGVVPYDIFLNETDKNLVKFELDHYWTKKAKVDSIKLMKKHPGRFPLWHIKDMENSPEQSFAEVGTGIIDYKSIFKNSSKAGLDLFFVEQDVCKKMTPLQSIELSFNNLKKLKV